MDQQINVEFNNKRTEERWDRTLDLMKRFALPGTILDLGLANEMSANLRKEGYMIYNLDIDLNNEYLKLKHQDVNTVTAFEVLEHILTPYEVLKSLNTNRVIITVPLKVWFSSAYWGKHDYDVHFHEFEPKQLLHLCTKAGYKVIYQEKWKYDNFVELGVRPILRHIWPSWMAVVLEKI